MTKMQLAQILASSCGTTKKAARSLLDTLAITAIAEVKKNGQFVIPGIGRLIRLDATGEAPRNGSNIGIAEIEVPPPKGVIKGRGKAKAPSTGRNTDWSVIDEVNREVGTGGEKFVFDLERRYLKGIGRPDLAARVEWTAKIRGDGLGYDIRSFDDAGREKFIEVKTTNGPKSRPFLFTIAELECAKQLKGRYCIYRLFHYGTRAGLFRINGPLEDRLDLRPTVFAATAR